MHRARASETESFVAVEVTVELAADGGASCVEDDADGLATATTANTRATVPMPTPSKPLHDHLGRGAGSGGGGQAGGTPVLPCGCIFPAYSPRPTGQCTTFWHTDVEGKPANADTQPAPAYTGLAPTQLTNIAHLHLPAPGGTIVLNGGVVTVKANAAPRSTTVEP